jgi:threonylcarbamoyladenosine tRNA methylthiotransferase MtaB
LKRVAFYTLGCKVNQVESEQLIEDFIQKGWEIVDFSEMADVYIINTCTVTHVSDRKSRAILRRAVRHNPQALIVATGCLAQVDSDQISDIAGIDMIVGNQHKEDLANLVEKKLAANDKNLQMLVAPIDKNHKLKPVFYSSVHQRTRAFIKVQDGCESFCSYCIVPWARGPIRSKKPADVIREARQLVNLGYKELVLTGIHSAYYGADLEDWDLARLVEAVINEVAGDFRIRLGSIEPLEFNERLIAAVNRPEVCRHFHIPLQSGCDKTLKAMNRRYKRDYYKKLVLNIAEKIPGAAFTADVMVGFPGESDEDFLDTYNLIKELPIADLHVFKYSVRPGTVAARLPEQVKEKVKNQRSERLLELGHIKKSEFITPFIGKELTVLVEKRLDNELYVGLSDNYLEITFSAAQDYCGQFVQICPIAYNNNIIKGKIID